VLHASNFAYAIGEKGRAIELGFVHLATESHEMPNVFWENKRILKRTAKDYIKDKNYGIAGRIYERLGMHAKATKTYKKGRHFEEVNRLDEKFKLLDKSKNHNYNIDTSVSIGGTIGGVGSALATAIEIISMPGGWERFAAAFFGAVSIGLLGCMIGQLIGAIVHSGVAASKRFYENMRYPPLLSLMQRPLPLPPYPIVFSGGEETKLLQSPETQAEKLESEGKIYEAGLIYAKMGNTPYATECANRLAKEGKLELARELWIMVFDTAYLGAEEMEKTDPEGAKAVFAELGIEK
jgi:hypothetical protein